MISKCGEGGFGQGGGEVGVGRRRCCSCSFSFSYVLLEKICCFINNNNFSILIRDRSEDVYEFLIPFILCFGT